jgi:Outer membrane protein beta-barrel domain
MKRLCAIACSALTGASLWASGGFGLGVQTGFDIGRGQTIVPRLDYLRLTDSSSVPGEFGSSIDLSATVNCFSLGADYDYYFGGDTDRGFYLLGGLGVARASIAVDGSGIGGSASTTSRQTVFYPEAGAGYQITPHLGVEVLYKALNFKDVVIAPGGVPVGYSFSSGVQASLVVRF